MNTEWQTKKTSQFGLIVIILHVFFFEFSQLSIRFRQPIKKPMKVGGKSGELEICNARNCVTSRDA